MRLLHMADVHLDSALSANLQENKRRERRQELLMTFVRTVEYAKNNNIEHILIAGDLFDTEAVSRTTGNVVLRCITDNQNLEFYYLKGNHDIESFLAGIERIPDNLHLFDRDWKSYELAEGIWLHGIELDDDKSDVIYDSLELNSEKFNIVTLHGQINEYSTTKRGENIALSKLRNKGIDYLALGHIHEYATEMLDSRGRWCYPGCLEARGFDECGPHGFCVLDIEENSHNYRCEFVPSDGRYCHEVRVDISQCKDSLDAVSLIRESMKENICSKDLVKLILMGNIDFESEINTEFIYQSLADTVYFLKIVTETKVVIDVSKYEYDQSLKGEFIRSVKADESIDDDMKANVIRTGLLALAGEEF